mmetsp:Transcript_78551/g.198250  ORF Transcript_78551/g.198250 Transcript_78551/m.198250 type:complete len:290 (-) Transcript_78551:54-923(-)
MPARIGRSACQSARSGTKACAAHAGLSPRLESSQIVSVLQLRREAAVHTVGHPIAVWWSATSRRNRTCKSMPWLHFRWRRSTWSIATPRTRGAPVAAWMMLGGSSATMVYQQRHVARTAIARSPHSQGARSGRAPRPLAFPWGVARAGVRRSRSVQEPAREAKRCRSIGPRLRTLRDPLAMCRRSSRTCSRTGPSRSDSSSSPISIAIGKGSMPARRVPSGRWVATRCGCWAGGPASRPSRRRVSTIGSRQIRGRRFGALAASFAFVAAPTSAVSRQPPLPACRGWTAA